MSLLVPVAGPYTATYTPGSSASGGGTGAAAQGILTDDGFRLQWVIHKQRIGPDGTDQHGLSLLEGIIRGADWNIIYRCREYAAGKTQVGWYYGMSASGNATFAPIATQAGAADDTSGYTGVLLMTAVSGTPAATAPATLTASHAVQAPEQQYSMDFTSKLREVPIMLNLYPYKVSSGIYAGSPIAWFTTT